MKSALFSLFLLAASGADLLDGYGSFSDDIQMERWRLVNSTAYSYSLKSNQTYNYLELKKDENAQGSYDDGLYYFIGDSKPQHISVYL